MNKHSPIASYFVLAPNLGAKMTPLKVYLAVTSISVFINRVNGSLLMSVDSYHRLFESFSSEIKSTYLA